MPVPYLSPYLLYNQTLWSLHKSVFHVMDFLINYTNSLSLSFPWRVTGLLSPVWSKYSSYSRMLFLFFSDCVATPLYNTFFPPLRGSLCQPSSSTFLLLLFVIWVLKFANYHFLTHRPHPLLGHPLRTALSCLWQPY